MIPIRQQIVVKPFPSSGLTEGGLIVPDSVQKDSNKVTVVSVGNGTKGKPMRLKPGNVGFRVKDWGEEIIINGEKHYLMEQDAILALE